MKYLTTTFFACLCIYAVQAQHPPSSSAFLGIYSDHISKQKASQLNFDNPYGSYVSSIIKNTAAEKIGLQAFDYVIGVNKEEVSRSNDLSDLLRGYEPGEKVTIHYIRQGKKIKKTANLGSKADAKYVKRNRSEDPFLGVTQFCSKETQSGVGVNIVGNSTAATLGLKDGDIITRINSYPILDWGDLEAGIDMLEVGETITLDYIRDGKNRKAETAILSLADAKKSHYSKNKHSKNYNYHYDTREESRNSINPTRPRTNSNSNIQVRPNTSSNSNFEVEKRDVSGMAIDMEEVTPTEANEMDMPLTNDLTISVIDVFPNPNMGMFELQFTLANEGETIINIYNALGRNIYNYNLGNFSGAFKDAVDISQNGTGFYFLEIQQDGKSMVKKIVLKAS